MIAHFVPVRAVTNISLLLCKPQIFLITNSLWPVSVEHLIALLTSQYFQILLAPRLLPVQDFVVGIFAWKAMLNVSCVLSTLRCLYLYNKWMNKKIIFFPCGLLQIRLIFKVINPAYQIILEEFSKMTNSCLKNRKHNKTFQNQKFNLMYHDFKNLLNILY